MLAIYTHRHLCVHLQCDNSSDNGGQLSSIVAEKLLDVSFVEQCVGGFVFSAEQECEVK
jgi:hypothetical protein